MAAINPILRLRRAFRSLGATEPLTDVAADDISEEAADAISEYGYSHRESDLRFDRMMAEMRQETADLRHYLADFRNQILLAMMLAAGLIIGAVGLIVVLAD